VPAFAVGEAFYLFIYSLFSLCFVRRGEDDERERFILLPFVLMQREIRREKKRLDGWA
jgi:hypothetical protein